MDWLCETEEKEEPMVTPRGTEHVENMELQFQRPWALGGIIKMI